MLFKLLWFCAIGGTLSVTSCHTRPDGAAATCPVGLTLRQCWDLTVNTCSTGQQVGYFFGYAIGVPLVMLCYLGVLSYFAAIAFVCFRTVMMCFISVRQWLYDNGRFVSLLFTLVLATLLGASVYVQYALGYSFGDACADLGLLQERFGAVRLASLSLISAAAFLFMQLLSVLVKALFKGKVKALFDLFRRGQAIAFFRLLLLPIIVWVEVHADELDDDLVASCRQLRAALAELQADNERDLVECADVLL